MPTCHPTRSPQPPQTPHPLNPPPCQLLMKQRTKRPQRGTRPKRRSIRGHRRSKMGPDVVLKKGKVELSMGWLRPTTQAGYLSTTMMAMPSPISYLKTSNPGNSPLGSCLHLRQLPTQPKNIRISSGFSITEWGAVPKWVVWRLPQDFPT